MKYFFFDLETTGLYYWKHSIHQIAGKIVVDGEVKEDFNIKMQPFPGAKIEADALEVAGIKEEDLKSYVPFGVAYRELCGILKNYVDKFNKKDKFHLVGYNNASFDNSFLRAMFVQNKDDYFGSWFWADSIDVMVLASHHLSGRRAEIKDFKLATVAKEFGVEVLEDSLHDAMYDINLTFDIFNKINNDKQAIVDPIRRG